jgi:hypothetical protein
LKIEKILKANKISGLEILWKIWAWQLENGKNSQYLYCRRKTPTT